MIIVTSGQALPLSTVIPNGQADLVVKALLQLMDGTPLTTVQLTEVSPGNFSDQSYPMPPNTAFVKSVFTVYDSDGVTPNLYNGSFDELFGVISSGGSAGGTVVSAEVIGFVSDDCTNIIGIVLDDDTAVVGYVLEDV